MQREEKELEASIDALVHKTKELKTSIVSFLLKLENEHEYLQWPSVLDNFALISSQMNSLSRLLKSDKCPAFRNYVVLPLSFSQAEKDTQLEAMTEGRLGAITHEVVPDYLRTKPQPEVEEKVNQITTKASAIPSDTMQKQIASYTRVLNSNIEAISAAKERSDADTVEKSQQSWSRSDTHALVAAVAHGDALKLSQRRQDQRGQQNPGAGGNIHMSKAPSAMKAGMSRGGHPYSRP